MAKEKKLCKWKKEMIQEDLTKLKKIVKKPRYICEKCGRVAKRDDYLCRPIEL